MKGGGICLNCFGAEAVLCCSDPRRHCSDACLLWTGRSGGMPCPLHSSLWQLVTWPRNGLPHWFFLWKICFRRKFCSPGRSGRRWARIWKLTRQFQIFIIPSMHPDIIMMLWTWMAFIPKGYVINMDILHFFKTYLVSICSLTDIE